MILLCGLKGIFTEPSQAPTLLLNCCRSLCLRYARISLPLLLVARTVPLVSCSVLCVLHVVLLCPAPFALLAARLCSVLLVQQHRVQKDARPSLLGAARSVRLCSVLLVHPEKYHLYVAQSCRYLLTKQCVTCHGHCTASCGVSPPRRLFSQSLSHSKTLLSSLSHSTLLSAQLSTRSSMQASTTTPSQKEIAPPRPLSSPEITGRSTLAGRRSG